VASRHLKFALFLLATSVLLSGIPAIAAYPDRAIKIIVPFAPGGGTDAIARVLAQEMAKDLGASIIIENKPGAGTIIGAQAVASAEADGYTLLMGSFAHAVNPSHARACPGHPRPASLGRERRGWPGQARP
jgi:tripartite-type tricarboxylate transporter receptor subunit TctC